MCWKTNFVSATHCFAIFSWRISVLHTYSSINWYCILNICLFCMTISLSFFRDFSYFGFLNCAELPCSHTIHFPNGGWSDFKVNIVVCPIGLLSGSSESLICIDKIPTVPWNRVEWFLTLKMDTNYVAPNRSKIPIIKSHILMSCFRASHSLFCSLGHTLNFAPAETPFPSFAYTVRKV